MSATNRAQRLVKLVATLKKRYKVALPTERPLFESLLYASMLENSSHEGAGKSIEHLESNYFDWNEVRVSTRTELAEALKPLNDPLEAADRLKRTLQSVFESTYAFDLEALKKQNLGVSVKQIAGYDGVTPFAVAYVTQNGLGGHAIATNEGLLLALQAFDIISEAERAKHVVPGLERAIPKNKGAEAFSLLHQLGVEVGKSPYGPGVKKLLLEIDPSCKDRLPKKPAPPVEAPPAPAPVAVKVTTKADGAAKKAGGAAPAATSASVPAPAAPLSGAPSSGAPSSGSKSPAKPPASPAKEAVVAKGAPAAKPATTVTTKAPANSVPATKTPGAADKKPAAKSEATKPGSNKGEAPKKGASQPVAPKKPEPAKSAAKKPETKKPEIKKPDAKKADSKKPDPKKPDTKKPEAKKPEPKKADAKKPATKAPESKQAAAKKPVAAKKPAPAKKPATSPPKRKPR